LVLLSDCPEDQARLIQERADLTFFERVYFSYQHQLIKEDKEFFEIALNGLSLPASDCLFIDDSQKNIEFARQTGLQSIQYTNAKELEKFFAQTVPRKLSPNRV